MADTYLSIVHVCDSLSLRSRITACASQEGEKDPDAFAFKYRWEYAAAPGWGAAFASAEAGGNTDPGASEDVITDPMILSEVQRIRSENGPA